MSNTIDEDTRSGIPAACEAARLALLRILSWGFYANPSTAVFNDEYDIDFLHRFEIHSR
jgi:hypothetical protein